MTEAFKFSAWDGVPPIVKKGGKRVKLPPYPGLPSESGKTTAVVVPRRKRKAPAQPRPDEQLDKPA